MTDRLDICHMSFHHDLVPELIELFSREYQSSDRLLDESYLMWLYERNPFGVATIIYAKLDGFVIGSMALIPVRLAKSGKSVQALFVVNVLVDSRHRGRKIFDAMIQVAQSFARERCALLMGHPNAAARSAWLRNGMHFHQPLVPRLIIPKPQILKSSRRKLCINELMSFLDERNDKMSRLETYDVLFSVEYLEWRYFQHPTTTYVVSPSRLDRRVVGVAITKKWARGINLLVENLVLDHEKWRGMSNAPNMTIALLTDDAKKASECTFLVPSRRRASFFCTPPEGRIDSSAFRNLGLSASDH